MRAIRRELPWDAVACWLPTSNWREAAWICGGIVGRKWISCLPFSGRLAPHIAKAKNIRRQVMWNKDEVKGKGKQIKGKVKDKVGEIIGNPDLEAEGEVENAEGHVQEGIGRTRRKAEDYMERVEDAINNKKNN